MKNKSEQAIGQTILAGDTNHLTGFWRNQIYNGTGFLGGAYAICMSKTVDYDGWNLNALDLLNLPNNTWMLQTLDLSALAANLNTPLVLSDSTVIQFQQSWIGDLNTSGGQCGIAFDNIQINCLTQAADFTFNVDCST